MTLHFVTTFITQIQILLGKHTYCIAFSGYLVDHFSSCQPDFIIVKYQRSH